MFNLLRMDLYRARKGKSVYVCLGILLLMTLITFALLWLMATPQGQQTALRIGMLRTEDLEDAANILEGADMIVMFRQTAIDGGMYNVIFGIWVMMFVCMDYQSGFIKNIMALHQNRGSYIGSKILTAGIVSAVYLILQYIFSLLMNRLFSNMVSYSAWRDVAFYLIWVWLLTVAFAALIVLICVWTRSVAAGALAAVVLGGGALVVPLYNILGMFHIGDWLKYSIYLSLAMGPGQYASAQDLKVFLVGIGFLLLYGSVSAVILRKQDI